MKKKNAQIAMSAVILLIILLLFYMFSPDFRSTVGNSGTKTGSVEAAYLHVIDVGQGDSMLLQTKDANILIDAGPGSSKKGLVSYLNNLDIDTIDLFVMTHPHEDHLGGAPEIFKNFDVSTVMMPDAYSSSKYFENILDAIENNDIEVIIPERGETFKFGKLELTVLAPGAGKYEETNNYSIVLKVTYEDTAFMFTGDAEALSEYEILENFESEFLKCDFIKAGHHGSVTSNTYDFITAVSPQYAAITCGEDNSYGHPHREVRELFEELGIAYTRTDKDGSSVYISDGQKLTLK